ncbi:MAG: hypothetical protein IPK99_11460 [Flavobacteriales bacterium]|nr:hypothetical protein [Flavobacteriales bacterium]
MKKLIPTGVLILGLIIVGLGVMRKDDAQTTIDLGKTEIDIGKQDSVFSGYFIIGGLVAAVGLVLLGARRKEVTALPCGVSARHG